MSTTAFDIRSASYSYETVSALENISLQIRQGERIALVGANGSGKSTLLRLLAALSFSKQGQILFFGQELSAKAMEDAEFFYGDGGRGHQQFRIDPEKYDGRAEDQREKQEHPGRTQSGQDEDGQQEQDQEEQQ